MFVKYTLTVRWTVSLALCGLTVFLGYYAKRTDFWPFVAAYGAFFGLYWCVCKHAAASDSKWYLGLGILLRVLLLFSIPQFSDDIYRFLWDGHLLVAGIHPFAHPPTYFIENQLFPPGITPELFAQLNSSRYFTVYPPVCQAVFGLAAWLAPHSIQGGVVVMKLFLFACEIGTIFLLPRLQTLPISGTTSNLELQTSNLKPRTSNLKLQTSNFKPRTSNFKPRTSNFKPQTSNFKPRTSNFELQTSNCSRLRRDQTSILYALNPLVLFEIMGNCHFEGAMIFFLVAALLALQRGKIAGAAMLWALAVASKLIPLLFAPLVLAHLSKQKKGAVSFIQHPAIHFLWVFSAASLVLFAPMLNVEVLTNMSRSLDLYFQKFQFNASVYYLLRELGFWIKGYDTGYFIGPVLGLVVFAIIGYWSLRDWILDHYSSILPWTRSGFRGLAVKKDAASTTMANDEMPPNDKMTTQLLLASLLQLTFAATIHSWYVTIPLVLGILTRWWRVAVLWSGMVALSYSHYAGGAFQENYWLIAVEYGVVWGVFFGGKVMRYRPK